jgi:TolB-like protein/tetratricopeptide (TPR) repeat protein
MTFALKTFGPVRLQDVRGNEVAFPEHGLLLLAYLLAAEGGSASRPALAHFLWGKDKNASLSNLHEILSTIETRQNELGVTFLSSSEEAVFVDRNSLSSDLLWGSQQEEDEPFSWLRHLVGLLSRPFMGLVSCDSLAFGDWLAERERYHVGLLRDALRTASQMPHTNDEAKLLRKAAIILFRSEPTDPDTLEMLVRILNAEGDVESFRNHFDQRRSSVSRSLDALNTISGKDPVVFAPHAPGSPHGSASLDHVLPRLVLLPPSNQSIRPDAGMLAASLIEDITIGFCAFNSLQVMAPHSAVQIGHQMETQAAFFKRHSVNYVLETRISSIRDDVTLFSQLIFFDDSKVVWAERFSLDHLDLIKDRRVLSRQIALSVSSEIERHQQERADYELNPAAYHRYLLGRRHLGQLTLPNLRRARDEMQAALSESPDFAPALSSIGRTYSKEWLLSARGDIDLLKSAETFATQAIHARSDLADGYRELGIAKLLQGAFDESASAMEVAETLSPHYADIVADHADTLVHCSLPSMALKKIERAIALNPLSPDTYLWTAAGANYALGEFEASLDYIDQMANPSLADRLSAASWAMLGYADRARVFVQRVREANPDFDVDKWLAAVPSKEQWHKDLYREGLKKAGF